MIRSVLKKIESYPTLSKRVPEDGNQLFGTQGIETLRLICHMRAFLTFKFKHSDKDIIKITNVTLEAKNVPRALKLGF